MSVVVNCSVMSDFVTPWTAACQASLSLTISQSLLKLMSIESVTPSNHLVLRCPFSCLQSFPESRSFLMCRLFPSGGQSTGASASASVLPMNIQGWPVRVTTDISQKSHDLFFPLICNVFHLFAIRYSFLTFYFIWDSRFRYTADWLSCTNTCIDSRQNSAPNQAAT